MKIQVKILEGDKIPSDNIKTGDIRSFQEKTAKGLIKKGIAEEVKEEKPKRKPRAKKAE
jgi:hypothetical protein